MAKNENIFQVPFLLFSFFLHSISSSNDKCVSFFFKQTPLLGMMTFSVKACSVFHFVPEGFFLILDLLSQIKRQLNNTCHKQPPKVFYKKKL